MARAASEGGVAKVVLRFLGAAEGVTGSRFLLEVGETRILVDCGLFQGHRKEVHERNAHFPIDAPAVHNVVLTHAHVDHSGALPVLVREGFRGEILCTRATVDLAQVLLRDSGHIQVKDAEYLNRHRDRNARRGRAVSKAALEPLYTVEDAERCDPFFHGVPYGHEVEIGPGIRASLSDQGHILGSAAALITIERPKGELRVLFSGDRGRADMPILRDPEPYPECDVVVTESTYGDRIHPPTEDVREELLALGRRTFEAGGRVIIPAFSVGRTQNIVYRLQELMADGLLPQVEVFVDSPLSSKATKIYRDHPECFDQETFELIFDRLRPSGIRGVRYVETPEESMALNERKGPFIVISASGMCEAGRILHHLKHGVANPNNLIVIPGFMAEHTLGRRLAEGARTARIFGVEYPVRAHIAHVQGLSAHGDQRDLVDSLHPLVGKARTVFLVHGEPPQSLALQAKLEEDGHADVRIAKWMSKVKLG